MANHFFFCFVSETHSVLVLPLRVPTTGCPPEMSSRMSS